MPPARSQYPITSSESFSQQPLEQTKSLSDLVAISRTASVTSNQLSSSVIHHNTICGDLPAIEEDRELKFSKHNAPSGFLQNTECSDSSSNSKLRDRQYSQMIHGHIDPRLVNRVDATIGPLGLPLQNHTTVNSSNMMSSHGRRGHANNFQERYPKPALSDEAGTDTHMSHPYRGGSYRGQTRPSITSASYAYHSSNEAFSSNYYPVSKQNSEVHSQSSGALGGGDTTDDNYSTFTDPSPHQTRAGRSSKSTKSSSDIHRIQTNLVILYVKWRTLYPY